MAQLWLLCALMPAQKPLKMKNPRKLPSGGLEKFCAARRIQYTFQPEPERLSFMMVMNSLQYVFQNFVLPYRG